MLGVSDLGPVEPRAASTDLVAFPGIAKRAD
jgi:hypothetical protein